MNESVAIPANEKLSAFEKIGYSLGSCCKSDISNIVTFIAFFYTDVYQIPADQAAWIIGICGTTAAFFSQWGLLRIGR